MITIRPIPRALVPVDSAAADRVSAPNYDEFQSDDEIRRILARRPEAVLGITMAHCDPGLEAGAVEADSDAALALATERFGDLVRSTLVREVGRALYVYEIEDPRRPGVRQIGLGGLARTAEIRTERTPDAPIIRNEGIRESKARGRARLIEVTRAIIGTVNHAVPDEDGTLAGALERLADAREPDLETVDETGNTHRVWIVTEPGQMVRLQRRLSDEPEAYVADGNHRSAAAAMLGYEHFLAVFFPADRLRIAPYNRLVRTGAPLPPLDALRGAFEIGEPGEPGPFQPRVTHEIGLYAAAHGWRRLQVRPATFAGADAASSIDHDIVQRHAFAVWLGIEDARDERLTFVGANRDAAWLQARVDTGEHDLAVTLPPVTMEQFVAVCRENRLMPPKSTWFEPKIRSGLVIALLD